MDATGQLKELICYDHDRPLKVFCRTDQLCICLMCVLDKHKNHDTVRASAERTEKQRRLGGKQRINGGNQAKRDEASGVERCCEVTQDYCHLSLDPNTAYKNVSLSRGNTQVINTDKDLQYLDHPDRFSFCPQVLCKRKVYGRSY